MASLRGGGPWGFRLQGGKDFGNPLSISKVAVRQVFVLLFKSLGFDLVVPRTDRFARVFDALFYR